MRIQGIIIHNNRISYPFFWNDRTRQSIVLFKESIHYDQHAH